MTKLTTVESLTYFSNRVGLKNLIDVLFSCQEGYTLVYCDNVSAVYLFSSLIQHQRTKNIKMNKYFIQEKCS